MAQSSMTRCLYDLPTIPFQISEHSLAVWNSIEYYYCSSYGVTGRLEGCNREQRLWVNAGPPSSTAPYGVSMR
jgi:hypothetical protein